MNMWGRGVGELTFSRQWGFWLSGSLWICSLQFSLPLETLWLVVTKHGKSMSYVGVCKWKFVVQVSTCVMYEETVEHHWTKIKKKLNLKEHKFCYQPFNSRNVMLCYVHIIRGRFMHYSWLNTALHSITMMEHYSRKYNMCWSTAFQALYSSLHNLYVAFDHL